MDDLRQALHQVADLIADYREGLPEQHVAPSLGRAAVRDALAQALPPAPAPLHTVLDELVAGAKPGLMASAGPRVRLLKLDCEGAEHVILDESILGCVQELCGELHRIYPRDLVPSPLEVGSLSLTIEENGPNTALFWAAFHHPD